MSLRDKLAVKLMYQRWNPSDGYGCKRKKETRNEEMQKYT